MLYRIAIHGYYFVIRVAAIFNAKAREWVQGRATPVKNKQGLKNTLLVHCASLGEFEQALPFLEAIHEKYPKKDLMVSFFSPSGYNKCKLPAFVKEKVYLPKENRAQLSAFIQEFDITAVVLVKYELWRVFIEVAIANKVDLHLICARFYKGHSIFKWWSRTVFNLLREFKSIHAIDPYSFQQLKKYGFDHVFLSGDTRFDRVSKLELPAQIESLRFGMKKVVVLGSLWKTDWEKIQYMPNQRFSEYQWIVAPHEVNQETIQYFHTEFENKGLSIQLFSDLNTDEVKADVLLVDTIGDLKFLYQKGDLAYVGGGFKNALHNILEPMSYGLPCLIGNRITNFSEAQLAIDSEVCVSFESDFLEALNKAERIDCQLVLSFIAKNKGATKRILDNFELHNE